MINVASDSALASTAEWGYYAGSKAYMTLYTEAMQRGQQPLFRYLYFLYLFRLMLKKVPGSSMVIGSHYYND